jgi:hypothetical protein
MPLTVDNHTKMYIIESSLTMEHFKEKGADDGTSGQESCDSGGVIV